MTIAACYVSPEGVVLGADSTSTFNGPGSFHYYNFGQKVFEIGDGSSLGLVTWGLGGLDSISYRTLIARLGDDLATTPAGSVKEVAERWVDVYWSAYQSSYSALIGACIDLGKKPSYDASRVPPDPDARTEKEEREFQGLCNGLVAGFCLGGYIDGSRDPGAYEIIIDPLAGKPTPQELQFGNPGFWGVPNLIRRLIFGCADEVRVSILASGKWNGTEADLDVLLKPHALSHPTVPIRDAVDFIHACISSTIKAMKFSQMPQVCGGPIEVAVITTDRKFRWVRHKALDAAISEGECL